MTVGYEQGLATIKDSLKQIEDNGVVDIHYWNDALRWLQKTADFIQTRNFYISALNILHHLYELAGLKSEILKTTCSLEHVHNDTFVLEKLLWVIAEVCENDLSVTDDLVHAKVSFVVEKVLSSGSLASVRTEVIPSLLRITSKFAHESFTSFYWLCKLILDEEDPPGKILWTMADYFPHFEEGTKDWWAIVTFMSKYLLKSSNLKAKVHIANVTRKLSDRSDCPLWVRSTMDSHRTLCSEWLGRSEDPLELSPELYWKYRNQLEELLC